MKERRNLERPTRQVHRCLALGLDVGLLVAQLLEHVVCLERCPDNAQATKPSGSLGIDQKRQHVFHQQVHGAVSPGWGRKNHVLGLYIVGR